MEGWFWRISDAATGRVVVVLCGVCHGASGPWTLVALAAAPGGFVRTAICAGAHVDAGGRVLSVPGGALSADAGGLRVVLGDDARLDVALREQSDWPRRVFGGLGPGHGVPRLGQYWHPHLLGAAVSGEVVLGDERWDLGGASAYAEKNWGAGFPSRWWWGQAQGFDTGDACVAFAGGDVRLGPLAMAPTAVVARVEGRVVRLGVPLAAVSASSDGGAWRVRARGPRHEVELEGDSNGSEPHSLPVPLPDERRVVLTAQQHFAGHLRLTVRRGRRTLFRGESEVAALERGGGRP
jgi:hypothetical protein